MTTLHRQGQGLSVNMIILIAIGLIVLIISILMFTRAAKDGQDNTTNCELLGGACLPKDSDGTCPDTQDRFFGKCPDTSTICCTKPANPNTQPTP